MTLRGYARTSTGDQLLDLQTDALRAAGVDLADIYTDQASGADTQRPGLTALLAAVRPGDTLVVWKLDRLGRSLSHLAETVAALAAQGVGFRSLTESIDTTTAAGRLVLHMLGACAEFERSLAVERITAGMVSAKKRGRHVGRPFSLLPAQIGQAAEWRAGGKSLREIAGLLGGTGSQKDGGGRRRLSASTVLEALRRAGVTEG